MFSNEFTTACIYDIISYDATLMTSLPKNMSAQWSENLVSGINWLMVITRVVGAIGVETGYHCMSMEQ